ncbi:sugar transferase [Bacteroides sp.]
MYKYCIKRGLDILISAILLFTIFPLLLIVAVGLYFANNKTTAFFFQERPGKNAKIFKIIKFKTMTDERDERGELLPDRLRLTKVGKLVRATSVDELPQLLNVLRGEMSLIGPRPLLKEFLPLYSREQMRRHEVRPGITGWAQVNGRNLMKYSKKFELDVWYVENCSFLLDLKIVGLTIKNVFKAEDIGNGIDNELVDDLHFHEQIISE